MIGYCPSAGRIQPRHLLSFSTDSTAIAQVATSLSHNIAYRLSSALSHPPPLALFLSRAFFPLFSSWPRATSSSFCAVRFGIDAAADIGGGKKNRTARREIVSTQGRATARSDRFIAATADGRLARRVSFLCFSPTRPPPTTLSKRNPRPSS